MSRLSNRAYRFVATDANGKVLLDRQSDGELTGANIGATVRGLLGGAAGFKPAVTVEVSLAQPEQSEAA